MQKEIIGFLGLADAQSFYLYMVARDLYFVYPHVSEMAHDIRMIYIYERSHASHGRNTALDFMGRPRSKLGL